ncbi:MAG: hypothetical protein V3U35_07565 [Candidatus Neomarinimicrobiota bacterium]
MRSPAIRGAAGFLLGASLAMAGTGAAASQATDRLGPAGPDSAVLWAGIDAMYSYRYHESELALDSAMALNPLDPVAPFVALANRWLMSLTEEGHAASRATLLEAIDATIPRYETMIAARGRVPEIMLYLGSTYGLKTRVYLADKSWLAGLYSGMKGWNMIRAAYAADTTLADAYLPIGVFYYYAGMQAAPVQIVARLFGIRPEKRLGIGFLRRAVDRAPHSWIESASTLAVLYLYIENEPEEAYGYARMLLEHYPGNYYFNFLLGEAMVRSGRLGEARAFMPALKTLFGQSHPNQRLEWELKYASLEADLAFRAGDWDTALERCRWVIEHYDMEFDWHLGFAHYLQGQIEERRGETDSAREDYRAVAALANRTYVVAEARAALRRLARK